MPITKPEADKLKILIEKRIKDELDLKRINEMNDCGKKEIDKYLDELTSK
mgnify:CR=1 FL=1